MHVSSITKSSRVQMFIGKKAGYMPSVRTFQPSQQPQRKLFSPPSWRISGYLKASPRLPMSFLRTAVLACPLENFIMPPVVCLKARVFIPRAAVLSSPLKNFQMSPSGCTTAGFFIPRAAISTCPLQYLQLPFLGCTTACVFIPWAAILTCPVQNR